MKLKDVKGVELRIYCLFCLNPVDLKDFIKCVAEFWRQEDAGVFSSETEKVRQTLCLAYFQEEILKLI